MLSLASFPADLGELHLQVAEVSERLTPARWSEELRCPPAWGTSRNYSRPTLGPAIALCAAALGTRLMPWQRHVADVAGELDPVTGRLVYREVDLLVPRQSGKTTLILAEAIQRCIGWGSRQHVIYTAQTRIAAKKKWEDEHIFQLMQSDVFRPLVEGRYKTGMGAEQLTWENYSTWGIESVKDDSGHGSVVDLGIIDEAFSQIDARVEQGMRPAMSTRPSAQLWVVSTAGEFGQAPYLYGKLTSGRDRIETGNRGRVAYFEWSAATREDPEGKDVDPTDRRVWDRTMPALGYTIDEETIEADQDSMRDNPTGFARAYLNLWPNVRKTSGPIDPAWWLNCLDETSSYTGRPNLAVDMPRDRTETLIAVAGPSSRDAERVHVEVVEQDFGADWVIDALEKWQRRLKCRREVVIDRASPAATLIGKLERKQWTVRDLSSGDVEVACGDFHDLVRDRRVAHIGQVQVDTALTGAGKSQRQSRWRFVPGPAGTPIAPLMAVVLAAYGYAMHPARTGSILETIGG